MCFYMHLDCVDSWRMLCICLTDSLLHSHCSDFKKLTFYVVRKLFYHEIKGHWSLKILTYLYFSFSPSLSAGKTNCLSWMALNDTRYVKSLYTPATVTNGITFFTHSPSFHMVVQYIYSMQNSIWLKNQQILHDTMHKLWLSFGNIAVYYHLGKLQKAEVVFCTA